jgi:hypothetical protein
MAGSTMPYQHLGEALATDYFFVREQFTDEQWDHFLRTRSFVDEEVLPAPTRAAVGIVRRGLHIARRSRDPDCFRAHCSCRFIRDYTAEFPVDRVRFTSIYTKGDGVVRWERAIVDEADCVEVTGSHIGLIANRKAYRAIAEALALPELGV